MAIEHAVEIKSLDDTPRVARLAARQRLLQKWYRPVAIAPFVLVLFISLKFFGDSPATPLWLATLLASLAWAILVAGYTLYLTFFGLRCPNCGWRYGSGEKCNTCGLPRHRGTFV
jgi:hypothetical protein